MEKQVITIRLNPREVEFIDRCAAADNMSRGEWLREIITAMRRSYEQRGEGSARQS